jgi:putative peptidoglycan lipid II flippase
VRVAQAAGVIALGNVTSRVLGLVRIAVKSGLFGAGAHVSALDAALRVPTTLYDLLVGGSISAALVPVLSGYTTPERREELWSLLGALIGLITLLGCGLLLLGEIFAPQVLWLLAGGLSPSAQALAVDLLRLVLPALLFFSLSGVLTGTLYALKRFTFPAFTAAVFNAIVVVVALLMGRVWGVHSMAIGFVVGSIFQVVLQLPGLRDFRFRLAFRRTYPALRRIGLLSLPILFSLVVDNLLSVLLSYNLASHLGDEAISWMQYAAQITQFPLGLVVVAVSSATLPTLSRQATARETAPFRTTLAQGLRLVLALVIPATAGLFVLAVPLIGLVFEHGNFTPADTLAVAQALRTALPGMLFAAIDQLLIFAFYARKDTLPPALVGVGTTILYAVTAVLLLYLGVLTLPLLVLINSLKLGVHAAAMLWLTRRRLGGMGEHRVWRLVCKTSLAALVMAGAVWAVKVGLESVAPGGLVGELLVVGGAGGVGAALYTVLARALDVEELYLLWAAFRDVIERVTHLRRNVTVPPPERME